MVATKLSEVAGKGYEWYSGGAAPPAGTSSSASASKPPTGSHPSTPTRPSTLSSSLPPPGSNPSDTPSSVYSPWNYAQDSISRAAEQTYNTVAGAISSVYSPGSTKDVVSSPLEAPAIENFPLTPSPRKSSTSNASLLTSPTLLNFFHNPSVIVRGGRITEARLYSPQPSSMEAVRSLLQIVPSDDNLGGDSSIASSSCTNENNSIQEDAGSNPNSPEKKFHSWLKSGVSSWLADSTRSSGDPPTPQYNFSSSHSETASQLAEGTLRALRDIGLDEAVELHSTLRYWSYRWERPLLSWLEAGPTVWFSQEGYQHNLVGQRVSQIQAVLARRCATIGDLQQHLLRAGWQRGVGQWGVLGDGGEWAAVAGSDGRMSDERTTLPRPPPIPPSPLRRVSSEFLDANIPPPIKPELPAKAPMSNVSNLPQRPREQQLYYTNVSVEKYFNGQIVFDDPALAEWSVDAMAIVRNQLYRAANGKVSLPGTANWSEGSSLSYDVPGPVALDPSGEMDVTNESVVPPRLPLWAKASNIPSFEEEDQGNESTNNHNRVIICDLPLMVAEVSDLLDVMESIMSIQRSRRLDKLKPPHWIRQNWYISAIAFPSFSYLLYKTTSKGYGWVFLKYTAQKFVGFFREHVVDPFFAMYDEFTRGIENVSDREARNIAIENLQKMIRSWLDETHPDMPVKERASRAKAMDISLIEAQKEESMKSFYEINSVIRMSFIEAQFLKKEMMNALLALDEMKTATNFNMNIAAVTPFVLFMYTAKRAFQFVFYAMLKVRQSREQTYGSFLHILIEMERLLVMRDNPPTLGHSKQTAVETSAHLGGEGNSILNADDLGMLMLHIHELRTILWRDRRRFTSDVIRSVAEDLAELAGERGAVSVRQQLQIISRMCRTYPFLKVASSAIVFGYVQR